MTKATEPYCITVDHETLVDEQGQHVWDTRQVPAGVYSVELFNNGLRVETKRLIVQPQN
jgi:hypothetical protein